ncbi:hypothetical protein, partial [Streptococcus suis]|uniref:hypothetical protein n=1 Tax=Streptococcus suis TaxID=1307 RepID=UPI001EDC9CB3
IIAGKLKIMLKRIIIVRTIKPIIILEAFGLKRTDGNRPKTSQQSNKALVQEAKNRMNSN